MILPMDRIAWEWAKVAYFECMLRTNALSGGMARHWRRATRFLADGQDYLDHKWGYAMATANDKPRFTLDRWVNVRLTEDDKAEIEALSLTTEDILAYMGDRIYGGYRFSLAYDDFARGVQVSLMCQNSDDPNYGLGLSSRHPELDVALVSLLHKDKHILAGDWSSAPAPTAARWD